MARITRMGESGWQKHAPSVTGGLRARFTHRQLADTEAISLSVRSVKSVVNPKAPCASRTPLKAILGVYRRSPIGSLLRQRVRSPFVIETIAPNNSST